MIRALDFSEFLKSTIGSSRHFSWGEALYLKHWDIHVVPEHPDVINSIMKTALRMDLIRDFFNAPITVTSWYRPLNYNTEIGGAKRSSHLFGMACDFNVEGLDADHVREKLALKLGELNIRMENLSGSNWCHIDTNCTENMTQAQRYFTP